MATLGVRVFILLTSSKISLSSLFWHKTKLQLRDSAQKTKILVMQSIPHPSKRIREAGFTGEVKMYDWNGDFEFGFVYRNGEKQKKITSSKRRNNPDNASTRWETVCKNYLACEFQSQCTGYSSRYGFTVIMAFSEVRDETLRLVRSNMECPSEWDSKIFKPAGS